MGPALIFSWSQDNCAYWLNCAWPNLDNSKEGDQLNKEGHEVTHLAQTSGSAAA